MKTITFYSYKGGVGRTLALVNIANRLAEFGKKVCVMDFDLEAPGLYHKYKHNTGEVKQGLVDYIYEFAVNKNLPQSIGEYAYEIPKYKYSDEKELEKRQNNIVFIPAGNSESVDYWKKLSKISWWKLFYEKDSEGLPFFLDLKERIKKEFNTDYLLIDTRTGITDVAALTMSILADSIVLLAVNNEENMFGMKMIIKTVTKKENNLLGIDRQIHFVLTRLPQVTSPEGWTRDEGIKNQIKGKIEAAFRDSNEKLCSFNVIHSNDEIALYDKTPVNDLEYLALFNSLTENDLSKEEKEKLNNLKRAEELLQRAYDSFRRNDPRLLTQLDEIEKLVPQLPDVYLLRGRYYADYRRDPNRAIELLSKAIDLKDISGDALYFRAVAYLLSKDRQNALSDFNEYISKNYQKYRIDVLSIRISVMHNLGFEKEKLIGECQELIEKYPNYAFLYNAISCLYQEQQKYESALKNIYKAIELNSEQGLFYATLAEINFCMDNKLEFYRNMDVALSKNYIIESILIDGEYIKNIYKQVVNDPEFIRILNKHNKTYFIELLQKDTV